MRSATLKLQRFTVQWRLWFNMLQKKHLSQTQCRILPCLVAEWIVTSFVINHICVHFSWFIQMYLKIQSYFGNYLTQEQAATFHRQWIVRPFCQGGQGWPPFTHTIPKGAIRRASAPLRVICPTPKWITPHCHNGFIKLNWTGLWFLFITREPKQGLSGSQNALGQLCNFLCTC